jgi:hypothetical protein
MIFNMESDYDKRKAAEYLAKLTERGKGRIELKQIRNTRSNRQNAWFHAVVKSFSDYTGYEKHEAKRFLKIAGGLGYYRDNIMHVKETHTLTTADFAEFMDCLMRWGDQNDFYIEDPERF